jgi:UDP-GlcNAc:undecaprenyl-phosphate GlcNAc-1-phosphate transferase
MPLLTLAVAFVISLLLVPLIRRLSFSLGKVAQPRRDRWHKTPTALLGGVGMFAAFMLSLLLTGRGVALRWELLLGCTIVFGLGIYDDIRELSPPTKLAGQILAAVVVVTAGYVTGFFENSLLNVMITVVWLVGITNAINLLDNMDGLAAGISLISAGFLAYFFWQSNDAAEQELLLITMALFGAILGFLIFNFPPAKIFMGDSGSLLLGFTLAALAIARRPQASNVLAVMSVPTLIFLLPILDTSLVMFTRLLRGQSPAQGGRDHTSHRLVAFGLSERQAVLVLYAIALTSGVVGATIEQLDYTLSLLLIPVIVLGFALLTAYLGRLTVVEVPQDQDRRGRIIKNLLLDLTYKRRMFEIALDFFLISISYYVAIWVRDGFVLSDAATAYFVQTVPFVLAATLLAFFVFGVYRGVWRYFGITDLVRFGRAVLIGAALILGLFLLLFSDQTNSTGLIFLYAVFLFLGMMASRSSFRILDQIYGWQSKGDSGEVRVLIDGAGDMGELALRWIVSNSEIEYRVIGFIDEDAFKQGRRIHGVRVLGGRHDLSEIAASHDIAGVITTGSTTVDPQLLAGCQEAGLWVRALRLSFDLKG